MRRHPKSGRPALYIGRWACEVEDLPRAEGHALIRFVQDFATQPEFRFHQHWQLHDAVLWDNRCTQHRATEFDETEYVRRMHCCTLKGEVPAMPAAE